MSDEGSDELVEDYEFGNQMEIKEKLDENMENGDEILKEISEQEKAIEQAFLPKPNNFENGDEILKEISEQQKAKPVESNDGAEEEADEFLKEFRDTSYN